MPSKMQMAAAASVGLLALSGCSSYQSKSNATTQLRNVERENATLKTSVQQLETDLSSRDTQLREYERRLNTAGTGQTDLLPPKAKPGECYARVFVPPTYKAVSKTVLKSEASETVETIPARYEFVEQQVLVKESTEQLKVIPAKFDWVEERVLVKEASTELVEEPATYETQQEKILVRDGYTTWKKGRGPIERIDDATGEIMCLVEVPPEYRTVTKRVLVKPVGVREVEIPAEYRMVRKRVVVEPAKSVSTQTPAEYKTVKVRKMIEPPKQRRTEIPAQYQEITDRVVVAEGQLEWRPILCETNTTTNLISKLQGALKKAGYNPGPVDGQLGTQTIAAVRGYQRQQGIAEGQLTMETLRRLQVM